MAWVAKCNDTYHLGTDPAEIEAKWYAMRAEVAKNPAGGKVGASELEDTFQVGAYDNSACPYLARAFAAYVNDRSADHLVKECGDAPWPRDWHQWRKDNWAVYLKAPFSATAPSDGLLRGVLGFRG
jgi:hypothetical protein